MYMLNKAKRRSSLGSLPSTVIKIEVTSTVSDQGAATLPLYNITLQTAGLLLKCLCTRSDAWSLPISSASRPAFKMLSCVIIGLSWFSLLNQSVSAGSGLQPQVMNPLKLTHALYECSRQSLQQHFGCTMCQATAQCEPHGPKARESFDVFWRVF